MFKNSLEFLGSDQTILSIFVLDCSGSPGKIIICFLQDFGVSSGNLTNLRILCLEFREKIEILKTLHFSDLPGPQKENPYSFILLRFVGVPRRDTFSLFL